MTDITEPHDSSDGRAPDSPASPAPGDRVRSRHPVRWVVLGIVVVVVVFGGVTVGRYVFRSRPGAQSVDAAVDRFRASGPTDTSPATFVRPAAGVYQAAGEGEEHISTPPNSQHDGATMPVSVTYLADGCWTWHLDYNVAHWHEFDFCPQGDQLLLVAQRNFQSWDFGVMKVDNTGTYTCAPPAPIVVTDPVPGAVFEHHCTGDNTAAPGPSTSEGPATVVGLETLSVGGADVATIHQTRSQVMSGTQQGDIQEEWWYAADTGLPVRAERHYRLDTGSVLGTITYTESGSWQLTSMEPRT